MVVYWFWDQSIPKQNPKLEALDFKKWHKNEYFIGSECFRTGTFTSYLLTHESMCSIAVMIPTALVLVLPTRKCGKS